MPTAPRTAQRAVWVLVAIVVLAAGLLDIGGPAQAKPGQAGRIVGGVEDGTFSRTCLKGGTADPGVLQGQGKTYRAALANGVGIVRILVPWNIATRSADAKELSCLKAYMAAARGNAKVEISLNRSASHGSDPSPAAYRKAVKALAKLKLGFSYVTAWNEPNNHSYLTDKHPAARAGKYFVIAHKIYGKRMVAGDFASGVSKTFLNGYTKALGKLRPAVWAIHPYTDVTNFQYYLSDQPANQKNPIAAAQKADATSKVAQFATLLAQHKYGSKTHIWLNEIYIDHNADKCPPGSHAGTGTNAGQCLTSAGRPITQPGKGKKFSIVNRADAALFLSGGLGQYSLPGMLAGKNVPQLTEYIYLRALDNPSVTFKDAVALQVTHKECVYYTLAGAKTTPAPQC